MNCLDVILFQAELTPEKLAIIAQGHVISYGKLAHGIISAQRRLAASGIGEGHTVGLNIAHPIDHLILICALYRLRVASARSTRHSMAISIMFRSMQCWPTASIRR